jgi:hypothetical protein
MKALTLAAAIVVGFASFAEAEVCNSITHEELTIEGRNEEWTGAQARVQPGDLILVFVRGKVKVGAWTGEVNPKGASNSGLGRLEMKVGSGTVVAVGDRWAGAFRDPGTVKFRVYDTRYRDNSGSFQVHLVIIPASALPPAVKVETE